MQRTTATRIVSASVSDRGLSEKRPLNEDSVLEMPEYGIFAVADGVGGAQAGEIASQMAVEIVAEAFANKGAGADSEELMRTAIAQANSAIYQMSSDLPQLSRMATTLVALHIEGEVVTIGHVGDSRLYRLDNKFQLFQETQDHSIVAEGVRAGHITAEQALRHPDRNIISRALGAEPTVEADIKQLMIESGTKFLLCSDGVTRHVTDEEIRQCLFEMRVPEKACDQLKNLCYQQGAEDNLSAVIINIPGNGEPDSDELHFALDEDAEEDTIATPRHSRSGGREYVVETNAERDVSESNVKTSVLSAQNQAIFSSNRGLLEAENTKAELSLHSTEASMTGHGPASPNSTSPALSPTAMRQMQANDKPGIVRLALPLLMLLIGAASGAGATYFWQKANPPQPQLVPVLVEKSSNAPLTAFEEQRRIIDRDPAAFLNANVAEPQDAADYYLLGRAYILSGKIWEAKRAFESARNKLNDSDETDRKTLAADIALGMAITNSIRAPGILQKELTATNEVENTGAASTTPAVEPHER